VIDYDVLSWGERANQTGSDGERSQPPVIDSGSAGFERYVSALAASRSTPTAPAAVHTREAEETEAVVWHAVDSDSDPDEDKAATHLASIAAKGARGLSHEQNSVAGSQGLVVADDAVAVPEALKGYIYILRRKQPLQEPPRHHGPRSSPSFSPAGRSQKEV
jgi:hypothetical protein